MDPKLFYKEKTRELEEKISTLKRKEKHLVYFRLFSFLSALLALYLLISVSVIAAVSLSAVFFILFLNFILSDLRNKEKIRFQETLLKINSDELIFLKGDQTPFHEGSEFIDRNHPYSSDLDIFGRASLFQFLNRTTGYTGRIKLAAKLRDLLPEKDINKNQNAIRELDKSIDWRQKFLAYGMLSKEKDESATNILKWMKQEREFKSYKSLRILISLASLITLCLIVLAESIIPAGYLLISLLFSFVVNYLTFRKVSKVHQQVSRSTELFGHFTQVLKMIESKEFEAPLLQDLRKSVFHRNKGASGLIHSLAKMTKRLDYRLNMYIAIPLNLVLFWDLQHVIMIEEWKRKYASDVETWFNSIGEFEALISLANHAFNRPEWCYPEINESFFTLAAAEMGHPLIPPEQRVNNDFRLEDTAKVALVTGSNMSGKTTFLRTIGINLVLAQTGVPVCARSFVFSPSGILTSMRISDSLSENTSSFYAELKRLKSILDDVKNKKKAILLLDEILRGTNSKDRHIGSEALIRQLIKNNAVGLLATHDLELSRLEKEMPENISNYNFDVRISGKELFFDYKLHPGVCKSMNATLLMEKMGIEVGS